MLSLVSSSMDKLITVSSFIHRHFLKMKTYNYGKYKGKTNIQCAYKSIHSTKLLIQKQFYSQITKVN